LIWIKAARKLFLQDRRMAALSLPWKLALLTAIKLVALGLIYVCVFAPASRAPLNAVMHIAGSAPRPQIPQ
jgi:hypothetical protein